jgi:pilus assembly protein CpaE
MADARRGTVITVFSTASAVGKTLIGINMAAELAKQGFRVCLVDLDLQFGDVCNYLQLNPTYTLADAAKALEREKDNFNVQAWLTTYDRYDVPFGVMAAPLKLEEAYNLQTSDIKQILLQLQLKFDFVVIDTASTFSEVNLMAMELSTIISFMGIVDFIPTIKNMKSGSDTIRGLGYDANKIRFGLNTRPWPKASPAR